jgi:hypothetical protein
MSYRKYFSNQQVDTTVLYASEFTLLSHYFIKAIIYSLNELYKQLLTIQYDILSAVSPQLLHVQ